MAVLRCDYSECEKSNKCFRFLETNGQIISYKNICKKNNNYKWLWEVENQIVVKEKDAKIAEDSKITEVAENTEKA